jgi:hypothetical protein
VLEEAVERLAEMPERVQLFGLEPIETRRKRGVPDEDGSNPPRAKQT